MTRAKIATKKRGSSEPVWLTGRPACHLMRRQQKEEREERGRNSTKTGGPTTKCSGRPSLSKGGTHRATGPVIIVVFKIVVSTAFSATDRGRKSPITCGVGMGKLRRHSFESRKESKGEEKDRRDERGKERIGMGSPPNTR